MAWVLLRASKCTMTPLLHEGGFILPAAYRSLQGLLTRGLQKVAARHEFSYSHPACFVICAMQARGEK